jgi:hypothetical protein
MKNSLDKSGSSVFVMPNITLSTPEPMQREGFLTCLGGLGIHFGSDLVVVVVT